MAVQVNPTRMELTRLKRRLVTAVRGHKLLKDKRDEMVRQFMLHVRRNYDLRLEVEKAIARVEMRCSIAKAQMGSFYVSESLLYPAPYAFTFTSYELDAAVVELSDLLPQLIELAEVEKTCSLLAEEIEKTRRRVNALEYVMIPEMQESIRYITMKLEENDRASLVRLMKAKEMMAAAAEKAEKEKMTSAGNLC